MAGRCYPHPEPVEGLRIQGTECSSFSDALSLDKRIRRHAHDGDEAKSIRGAAGFDEPVKRSKPAAIQFADAISRLEFILLNNEIKMAS